MLLIVLIDYSWCNKYVSVYLLIVVEVLLLFIFKCVGCWGCWLLLLDNCCCCCNEGDDDLVLYGWGISFITDYLLTYIRDGFVCK